MADAPDIPDFIPPDDEPMSAEEEFAALEAGDEDLLPDEELAVVDPEPAPIGRSWAFDFISGRFLLDAVGPIETSGDDTLAFWIEKCLRTARGAHPIYASDFGIEGPNDMIGQTLTAADYADLSNRVHEALTFHPRIADVIDFDAYQDDNDEMLFVSFTVIKDDGDTLGVNRAALGFS